VVRGGGEAFDGAFSDFEEEVLVVEGKVVEGVEFPLVDEGGWTDCIVPVEYYYFLRRRNTIVVAAISHHPVSFSMRDGRSVGSECAQKRSFEKR